MSPLQNSTFSGHSMPWDTLQDVAQRAKFRFAAEKFLWARSKVVIWPFSPTNHKHGQLFSKTIYTATHVNLHTGILPREYHATWISYYYMNSTINYNVYALLCKIYKLMHRYPSAVKTANPILLSYSWIYVPNNNMHNYSKDKQAEARRINGIYNIESSNES